MPDFRKVAAALLYGDDAEVLSRVACVQTISGTGALRVAAEFLKEFHPSSVLYITEPTWANHRTIFEKCGFRVETLRYFDESTKGLHMSALMEDMRAAPDNSIMVLHTCAHNPTGVDPSPEQWAELERLVREKRHTVLFDTAYQGYASGSIERDGAALRMFVAKSHNVVVCQSFAKNMGLYGERAGTCSVYCNSKESAVAVESRLEKVIRPMYSNPPKHPALIVATILSSPELKAQWLQEVKQMSDRIAWTRETLVKALKELHTPGSWTHITSQIGMFSFTGLTKTQVEYMTKKHHVYLLPSGRISMAGINSGNVQRLAVAIDDAVRNASKM